MDSRGAARVLVYAVGVLVVMLAAPAAFAQGVTLSTSNITITTVDLTIANHSGSWYWKWSNIDQNTSSSCSTEVTGTETTVTGLNKLTRYQFTAYSNTSCSTQLAQTGIVVTEGFTLDPSMSFYTEGTNTQGNIRVTVPSGITQDLTASLAVSPTGKVTLPSTASFTVNGARTVAITYTIPEDDDGRDESITVTGTVTAGQSDLLGDTSTATITISDDDAALTLSATKVALIEGGGNGTYTLKLAADPVDDVTVTVTSNDTDAVTVDTDSGTTGNQSTVTFTGGSTGNWNTAQTITLTPVDDTDENDESVTITHRVPTSNNEYRAANKTLTVAVGDNDAVTLTASSVEDDTATLTIASHTGDWYYKYTVPSTPAGTCSTVVSSGTDTASLSSLTPGTNYTYKAYSDNQCDTELTSDARDAEFLTKPGQTTNLRSSPYHKGTYLYWSTVTGAASYLVQWKSGAQEFSSERQKTATNRLTTLGDLTNGTEYTFRVLARNATGDGDWSATATGTPVAAELTPDQVQATSARLTLSNWSTFSWWYKQTSPSDGSCSASTTNTTASLTGLSTGTSHTFKAYSDDQCSTELTTDTTDAELLTKPGRVTGVTATSGNASLAVSWTALSGTVTGYKVQWKKDNENYSSERTNTVTGGGSTTSTITGLTNDTQYTVRVTAYNATGDGTASSEATATPAVPPVTLTASAVEDDTATLTLTNHTGDWYYKYTVPSTPAGTCSTVVSSGTYTASLSSLTPGTSYTYKAYSNNQCTTELTTDATDAEFHTKPGQVTGVTATGAKGSLTVSWTAATGATGYTVQWKTSDQQFDGSRQATPTSNSHKITGLTDGTAYTIRVRASTGTVDGDWSAEATGTPAANKVPSPDLTVTGGTRQLTASWDDPLPDTTGLTWRVRYRKAGTITWKYVDASSNSGHQNFPDNVTSTTVPGHEGGTLDDNATYEVQVRGGKWNQGYSGWGPWSGMVSAPTKPGQVTGVTVTPGNASLSVSWTALSGTVTGYKVQWKSSDQNYDGTRQNTVTSGASSTITGLTNNTQYTVRVTAYNAAGDGTASSEVNGTPAAPAVTLTASAVEDDTATLTIANHTGNWYYQYTSPPGGTCSATAVIGASASLTGLSGGTTYTFKAYSNSGCSTELATAPAFTTKPAKVSGVQVSALVGALSVSWTAPTGATSYKVQWKSAGQQFGSSRQTSSTTTSATITGLTGGTEYTIRVAASTGGGDGEWSDTATGTPLTSGVTLSALTPSTVPEGGSATYTVVLNVAPADSVTIAVANRGQAGDDSDLTVSPGSLTFGTANWNAAQTVTVTARQDSDVADGSAVITHAATSSDNNYNGITIDNKTVTEADDDAAGVQVSQTALSVPEGGSATYTVRLATLPAATVTIDLAKQAGGDGHLTFSPPQLSFTTAGWDLPQRVTVSAAQDADAANGTATITHTATSADSSYSGITIANVTATEDDDELGVTLSRTALTVPEGSSATYTVVLDGQPSASVTITVAKQTGGDASLTVAPASLTFGTGNWNTTQTVTVSAAQDNDDADGAAVITHTATSADASYSGIAIANVTATEDDDDLAGVTLSRTNVTVTEGSTATYTVVLDTQPTAGVTIAVAKQTGGDASLTVAPASLTFTTSTYNTAQTVTVSAAQDNDDVDGTATITHTATSADASYGGIAIASVTATEDDDDATGTAPTSAHVTLVVSRDNRTAVPLSNLPFSDKDSGDTLHGVRIVTPPGAADGTLGLVKTGVYAAAASATALCVGTITPITAGQEVLNTLGTVLYFCPKDGFNRTTFLFKVIDSSGRASAQAYTATLVAPPGQVTGLKAEAGSGYVRLSWPAPKNPAITGYEYRQKSGVNNYGAWTAMTGSGATTTAYSVTGLTNATAYTFQVRARSAGGAGPIPSAAVTATPAAGVKPAKPTGLQVVNLGFNTAGTWVRVRLVWDDPKDPSITRYEAEREWSQSKGNWLTPIGQSNNHVPNSGPATTSAEFDAGSNQNEYAFRVRAVNTAGNGPWSETVRVELASEAEIPVLESVEPGNGHVRLRWTHSGLNLKKYGGYWGYRNGRPPQGNDAGTGTDTSIPSAQAGTAARSYVVTGLTNGSTYTYAVYSWGGTLPDQSDARHAHYSNTRTLTLPAAPAKPAGLTATATPAGASLSWTDPKNNVITGWQYRQKAGVGSYGSWTRVPGSKAGTTSASVPELADGTTYTFQVRAVIEYGTALGGTLAGTASDEASTTPVGVVVSKDRLALTEGGAAGTYTVKLSRAPTQTVTITVSVDGDGSVTADTDDTATGNQDTLTFTTGTWDTAKTVKVKAAEDDDGRDSTATIAHAAASADARYNNLTSLPGLTATVIDNDGTSLTLSKTTLSVTEGGTATYTVRLSSKPSDNVTVRITRDSGGDTDLTVSPGTLTFTGGNSGNYATPQTVTVSAAQDNDDAIDGTATFTHEATGGGYGGVTATLTATETDNDEATLTAGTATATGLTLTIGLHSNAWRYKYTTPDGGTCSSEVAAGTSSATVTGLASNVAYTFKAYSDNDCSTELATAAAYATLPPKPATPALTVNLGSGTVRVASTVTGTAPLTKWQYKKKSGGSFDAEWSDISSTSTGLSHTVTGLIDNTAYTFKVRARNASGTGAESDESAAATPQAPTLAAGTATATGLTLTIGNWSPAWSYKYTTPDGGACSTTAVPAGTSSAAVTGLSSNVAYTFKAYSDGACASELATAAAYATLPPKPATPTASSLGSGTVRVTSTVTGTAPLTKWQYKKKSGGSFDADWSDISSTSTGLSHTVTGLTNGTAYTFKVRARNASGAGAESDESAAATPRAVTLTTGTVTATGLTLTIGNHSDTWRYKYTTPSNGTCSSEVAAGTSSATVTGLASNTAYTFKAYSDDNCDTELATAASVPTLPPKPATPTLTVNLGSGTVRVASTVTGTAPLTKWQYKKKEEGGSFDADWSDISSTSTGLSHTVTGLTDGTAYTFKVRARNASGAGAESDESAAATPRAVTLTTGTVTATGLTLTLDNHSDTWRYKYTTPSNGTCSSEVAAGTSSATVTGLASNTAYTFKAYSDNNCDTELVTAESVPTLPPKPATPALTVNLGSGTVRVTSTVTGTAPLTKWQYKKKEGSGNFDADWSDVSGTSTGLSHTVTGLTDGTAYTFKVRARNASGAGAESDESAAGTPRAVTLAAGTATATGLTLTLDNHSDAWRYKYTTPSNGTCSSEVAAGTSSATVTGLASNTAYTFKAYSDTNCDTEVATASSVPTLPPKPAKPTLTVNLGSGTVRVASTVTGTAPLTRWQYKKKASGGNFDSNWSNVSGTSTGLSHTVTGLTNGTAYTFKVRAENASGEGAESDESDPATPVEALGTGALSIANQTYLQHTAIAALTLPAATGGSAPHTYTLARTSGTPALPAGLTFDPGTRTLTGTPTAPQGATGYTYTVTDADNTTATLTFTIMVEADLVPTFGDRAIPTQTYIQHTGNGTLTLPTATGGNPPVTYSLAPALPAGLTFDPGTRTLTGTPTEPRETTRYTYAATDGDGDAATLTFTLTVEEDLVPTFGDLAIAAQTYRQHQAITALTLPPATSGNPPLTYSLAPALPEGLTFDPGTRALAGTPTAPREATRYTYTATDVDGDEATLTFTITVRTAADKEILEDVLAAQGRALLSSATGVIGARFRTPVASGGAWAGECAGEDSPPDEDEGAGGAPRQGGPDGESGCTTGLLNTVAQALLGMSGGGGGGGAADFADETDPRQRGPLPATDSAWDWEQLVWGRSFALPLKTPAAPESTWTLWGAGDVQGFRGSPRQGSYDGQVRSLYLGLDKRWQAQWLTGVALARSWGETDYVAGAGGSAGRVRTSLASVYPYVRGELDTGLEVWALGGYGRGKAKNARQVADGAEETSDLTMVMGATGARQPMTEWGGVQLAVVGGAGYLTLGTEAGEMLLGDLDVGVQRVRLALEATGTYGGLAPYVQAGGRYDGGAGQTGTGLETVAGVRYTGERLEFEARGRWLATHSAEGYEEYGGMARLAVKPRPDGTGLRLTVAPSWGRADAAGGLLNSGGPLLGGSDPSALGPRPAVNAPTLALESDLGYGVPLLTGVLTPAVGYGRTDGGSRVSLGVTYASPPTPRFTRQDLSLRFGWTPPATVGTPAGYQVEFLWSLGF